VPPVVGPVADEVPPVDEAPPAPPVAEPLDELLDDELLEDEPLDVESPVVESLDVVEDEVDAVDDPLDVEVPAVESEPLDDVVEGALDPPCPAHATRAKPPSPKAVMIVRMMSADTRTQSETKKSKSVISIGKIRRRASSVALRKCHGIRGYDLARAAKQGERTRRSSRSHLTWYENLPGCLGCSLMTSPAFPDMVSP
jgi:hypothetical protein